MRFHVASELNYSVSGPATLILNVHALRNDAQSVLDESFTIEPNVPREEFVLDHGHNRFVRLKCGPLPALRISYRATVETRLGVFAREKLGGVGVSKVDRHVIPFIYPSRYCQSDQLGRLAYGKFGKLRHPLDRVRAISAWIFKNVEYLSGSTNWQTSAYDTVTARAGVCRDFAHLGIALCRALDIPARYFAGYAHQLQPPDFHACFEAHVGGQWLIFDPTQRAPLNGLVCVARGRDAADTAVATLLGPVTSQSMTVSCEPAEPGFKPLPLTPSPARAVSLEPA